MGLNVLKMTFSVNRGSMITITKSDLFDLARAIFINPLKENRFLLGFRKVIVYIIIYDRYKLNKSVNILLYMTNIH